MRIARIGLLGGLAGAAIAAGWLLRPRAEGCALPSGDVQRRALVVGVSDYANPEIPDLAGPVNDARAVAATLVSHRGFAPDAVCVLEDSAANKATFVRELERLVLKPARSGDLLFVFFAGHGGRQPDADDSSGWEDTLLFHDAFTKGVEGALPASELRRLLDELESRGATVFVALDAGHTPASPPPAPGRLTPRYFGPESTIGLSGPSFLPPNLDGAVLLSAARRPYPAFERDGRGLFTQALVAELASRAQPSAGELAQALRAHVSAFAEQWGRADGDLTLTLPASPAQGSARGSPSGDSALSVRLASGSEPGAIAPHSFASLDARLGALGGAVKVVREAADLIVRARGDQELELVGADGRVRNEELSPQDLPAVIRRHSKQRQLLLIRGEDALGPPPVRATVVAARDQNECARPRAGMLLSAGPNAEHLVPTCVSWSLRLEVERAVSGPLEVAAIVLRRDGTVIALPGSGTPITAAPGDVVVLERPGDVLPPLLDGETAIVRVFAAAESSSVPWSELLDPNVDRIDPDRARGWWTATFQVRGSANPALDDGETELQLVAGDGPVREYTLAFDIRPYLPADEGAALHRLLSVADQLVRDEVPYNKHGWTEPDDAANLALGIDCTRSLWFAFTRAGLKYTLKKPPNDYLPTALMVGPHSAMRDMFDACDGVNDLRIGDVLVFRDDKHGDGHAVLAIDPERRIAWGSHNWDGMPQLDANRSADKGVEYQVIRTRKDWSGWDRKTMTLRNCWRHRDLAREHGAGRSRPPTRSAQAASCSTHCRPTADVPAGQ